MNGTSLQSGVCFAAYPDAKVAGELSRWIGCQRHVINCKVEEDKERARAYIAAKAFGPVQPSFPDQAYSHFHTLDKPWLREVPSQILRNGAVRFMAAKSRQMKKLAKAPKKKNRSNGNTVTITDELFHFVADPATGALRLFLGTPKNILGELPFKAHRPYGVPKTLCVRRLGHRNWTVSFCYEHTVDVILRTPTELAYELNLLDDKALAAAVFGIDRNVTDNSFALSNGRQFALTEKTLARIARKEKGLKRHQRKYARQQKGSRNSAKTRDRMADKRAYPVNALKDFTHKASYAIASMEELQAAALEALKIKNMVAKPKAKQDPVTGKWLRNGARAKSGLAKAILARGWGRLSEQLAYKLARRNKVLLFVAPHYSSQECSDCGHTHADNRRGARFVCLECKLTLHADENASRVQAKRAIAEIRAGAPSLVKVKKRVTFQKKERAVPKVQLSWTQVRPENNIKPGLVEPGMPVEEGVSRKPGRKPRWTRSPKKQERLIAKSDALTTAPQGA